MFVSRTVRRITLAAFAAVLGMSLSPSAAGAEPSGTPITPGWLIYGATIKTNGEPARHLNDNQAAAFLQSWLPASMLPANVQGALPNAPAPPKTLPVSTIEISDSINGTPGKVIVYWVAAGNDAWVGMPPQDLGNGVFVSKQSWFAAPTRAKSAFLGKEKALPVDTPTSTTPITASASPTTSSSSGSNTWIWFVVAVVVVIVAGTWIVVAFRRRDSREQSPA